jgi:hypothetical protein
MGYDVPPFASMTDFKIWDQVEPPKGTVYHYPIRPSRHQQSWIACAPAPPEIAVQISNRGIVPAMLAKLQSGRRSSRCRTGRRMSWKVSSGKRLIVERSDMRIAAYHLTMHPLPIWPLEKAGCSPWANRGSKPVVALEL